MSLLPRARRLAGFSMIEMMLVLTIMAAILVGVFVLYPKVRDASQSKEESGLVKNLVNEVRKLYPSGNYAPLMASDLVGGSALPRDYYTAPSDTVNSSAGGVLANRFGGGIDVYPSQADGTPIAPSATGTANFFAVRYWGGSPGLCRGMVAQLVSSQGAVLIDDDVLEDDKRVVKNVYTDSELDPSQTAAGCRNVGAVHPRVIVVSD